jgi:hypothetical protein
LKKLYIVMSMYSLKNTFALIAVTNFVCHRPKRDGKNFIPACSNSCMCGLCSTDKRNEIREFKDKYGDGWKNKYTEYVKD